MAYNLSLNEVMNAVSVGLARGATISVQKIVPETLSEMGAFAALDPLLSDLHKQYIDARAMRIKSTRDNGTDDAMTDMAQLVEDSAWCAMQTRYMELRSDRKMMLQVQTMMRGNLEEIRLFEKAEKEQEALKTILYIQMVERMHGAERHDSMAGWWFMFYLLVVQPQAQFRPCYPAHHFNQIAA